LGTGLANLRERLQLAFNGDATVDLASIKPRGTVATINFPAGVAV
jgi:sensor histidine kinase YesM